MMKMSGRITSCCAVLFLALTSVSAVQKLNSISDLKKINFGPSVPKHSLVLLHWFANTVHIDNNDVIWLTFDPNNGDFGSHHYGNYEGLLDPLPRGNVRYRYYTVGNLYQETSDELPTYVVNPSTEYDGENRDRIIMRVREHNTGQGARQRIDQVYITQHYDTSEHQGTPYDPEHTYQITINLLRQIREFSVRDRQRPLLYLRNRYRSNADDSYIRNKWGDLACLGLLLFIVIEEKHVLNQRNNRPENNDRPKNKNRPKTDRPENNRPKNDRPQVNRPKNDRPKVNRPKNDRPQVNRPKHNSRREFNNRPEINSRPQRHNRQSNCCRCSLVVCSFFTVILVAVIVFLGIYFGSK